MTTELVELTDKWDRQAAGNGGDRANALSRCADELRALASRAGGWRPIDSAPRDRILLLLFPEIETATAGAWRGKWSYTDQQWVIDTPLSHDGKRVMVNGLPQPIGWQPLPEPPAAPEPVAVGSNNLSNDEER